MRRLAPALVVVAAATALAAAAGAHDKPGPAGKQTHGNAKAALRNMRVVGHLELGAGRTNGDVWLHRGHAYVGDWDTSNATEGRFCTKGANEGVAVVDVRAPARPRLVSRIELPPGTWAEDVSVFRARFGPQAGRDIAVVGIQICGGPRTDASRFRGFTLWDVTDPARPAPLGGFDVGCCTLGVHVLEVRQRADLRKAIVYATVPYAERDESGSPSGRRDRAGRGEVHLVDVTDATAPQELSTWGIVSAGLKRPGDPRGCFAGELAHAVEPSADGTLAFVSYWDAGFIQLDVRDPTRPVFRNRTSYPATADGDGHSTAYDAKRKLLFAADEDFCPGRRGGTATGWGFLRIYDVSRPGTPRQIGTFRTPGSVSATNGTHTIHNPVLVGNVVWASWYADGVRVIDTRNPRKPRELASFAPAGASVWGVVVDRAPGLAYASDMRSGLWILKRTR